MSCFVFFFFFSSRRRHTRFDCDWSSDVCSSDLGRYSVLSDFGMVPAAAIGIDTPAFLERAAEMVRSCAVSAPPVENPGVILGAILGVAARQGRDKLTIITSPGVASLGAWLEQLLAESTGKLGRGIVPIDA